MSGTFGHNKKNGETRVGGANEYNIDRRERNF